LKLNQLFATRGRLVTLGAGQLDEPAFDLGKQRGRQRAVVARVSVERPDIRSWPNKPVAFGQDDPGAVVIEAQALFGCQRNFDCVRRVGWWGMENRSTRTAGLPSSTCATIANTSTGPILVALFATFEKLPMPEVRVAKEPADFWFSRQHACPSGPQH